MNRTHAAALLLTWLLATPCVAEQFILFDVTFTYTKEDADNSKPSKSHYYVKSKMLGSDVPKDWTSPVDYRNGTAHVRLEVLDKRAGSEPTTWSICYIPIKAKRMATAAWVPMSIARKASMRKMFRC